MSAAVILAVLVLHPVLDEAMDLRLVATGETGRVEWSLDGNIFATTDAGEAVSIATSAGPHEITARTTATGAWAAMARPEPEGPGARFVEAWYAEHPGPAGSGADSRNAALRPEGPGDAAAHASAFAPGTMWAAAALAVVGLALVAGPALRRR